MAKLKSDHPLAQSKWHGVGLNLHKTLSPQKISHLSTALLDRKADLQKRLSQQHEYQAQIKANPRGFMAYATRPGEVEKRVKNLSTRISRLHDLAHGLHHKPAHGDHDEWMAGKK